MEVWADVEEYGLNWPGKRDAIALAADLLAGGGAGNRGELLVQDIGGVGNLFIEGDNLAALQWLLHDYRGRVKMIYIDPPYNTGNGYSYHDRFSDHARWLSMMYPRLVLARELLSDVGLIFISINDVELANLTLICREIFGEDNYLNTIIWHYGKMSNEQHRLSNNHEYVLVFRKTALGHLMTDVRKEDSEYRNRYLRLVDDDNRLRYGPVKQSRDTLIKRRIEKVKLDLGKLELGDADVLFDFNKEYKRHSDVIYVPHLKGNSAERIAEFGTGQKPLALMELLLRFGASEPDSLVLDFFAGSGTTGEAVLQLNAQDNGQRRFILVQSAELLPKNPNRTIANICQDRLTRATQKYHLRTLDGS